MSAKQWSFIYRDENYLLIVNYYLGQRSCKVVEGLIFMAFDKGIISVYIGVVLRPAVNTNFVIVESWIVDEPVPSVPSWRDVASIVLVEVLAEHCSFVFYESILHTQFNTSIILRKSCRYFAKVVFSLCSLHSSPPQTGAIFVIILWFRAYMPCSLGQQHDIKGSVIRFCNI